MNLISRALDYLRYQILEPALQWILTHPIPTVLIVAVLVWWVGQAYKTKIK